MIDKPVLDATCGSKMIWFNKNNKLAVYVDRRELDCEAIWTSGDGQSTSILILSQTSQICHLRIILFITSYLIRHILLMAETMPGW